MLHNIAQVSWNSFKGSLTMAKLTIKLHFDILSPFTYLAFHVLYVSPNILFSLSARVSSAHLGCTAESR